jgi:DNA-binding Lrp family transcriptional regulator
MTTEDHEPITYKDKQLIQLIISQPSLTNSQTAKLLGVSKQAVSDRKKRLVDEGIIENYIFWNVVPKRELTKTFEIIVEGADPSQVEELTNYLIQNRKVAFVWLAYDGGVVSGVIVTDQENLFIKILRNEFPFVKSVKLQPIEFRKFLGQHIALKSSDERSLHEIVCRKVRELSRKKSVDALLFFAEPKNATINIVVLRNKRFHRHATMTFSDKIVDNTYVHILYGTYEILKGMVNNRRKRIWTRKLRIAFTRNKQEERRLKYLLRLARHV